MPRPHFLGRALIWPGYFGEHILALFGLRPSSLSKSAGFIFYLGKLHWFLYLLLSYYCDPGIFIFCWSSNFVEKVAVEWGHGGEDGISCLLPCILLLYIEWIWTNYCKLSRNFVGAIRTTTINCRVSFIDLYLVFPRNFRMVFLPHTNTVILLEPYSGTITERWLPVVSWNAASKACLQALPPFPPPQATAQLASLPRIFFLFKISPFHAFFPNCGAWSQASPHFLTIGYC